MKHIIILAVFVSLNYTAFCQNTPEEIVAAIPEKENIALIDTLIKVSGFDTYFNNYCSQQIDKVAKVNNWDSKRILKQKLKINFKDFRDDVYNAFSFSTKKELEALISFCKTSTNPDNLSSVILRDSMIRNNLPLFAKRYLK